MSIRFPDSRFIADAKVSGSLYDLGAYPGLLLNESTSLVNGEVYEVDDETLGELDQFELSSDYQRKQVEVFMDTERKKCWIYVPDYGAEFFSDRTIIISGDWIEYVRSRIDQSQETGPD